MDKIFLRACRGEPTDYTPIWLNRQAGRYMREYHEVKGATPSLAFFKNPELAARATLDAQRILGVDAAILFADLLPILEPMGLSLDYKAGEGPVFANPVRTERDVDALVTAPRRGGDSVHCADGPQRAVRAAAADRTDRLCGRTVHAGVLCDRGQGFAQLRPCEEAHVSGPQPSGTDS
jgi:uroporphyrinogen decarboxylase